MKKLLLTFLMLSAVFSARAQKLAVNTDVLMDACMIPSVGLEMTVGNWSTLGLNVLGCNKPYGKNIKLLAAQPEYRYYFSGRPMHSLFVGVGGVGAIYDASIKGKVYRNSPKSQNEKVSWAYLAKKRKHSQRKPRPCFIHSIET